MGRDPICLARSNWSRVNVTISLQNILQWLHSPFNRRKIAILIQTPTQSCSWMTMIQLCLLLLFHIVSVSGAWEAHCVAAHVWTLSFTDMGGDKTRAAQAPLTLTHVKQVLKTFKSAFMLLLVQKEQHKPSFQPHIFISVLQTFQ